MSCEPDQQRIFSEERIARNAWNLLKETYGTKSFVKVKQMNEDFERLVKLPSESCQAWIRRVKDAALDLSNAGKIIDEEDIAYKLLSGLPE